MHSGQSGLCSPGGVSCGVPYKMGTIAEKLKSGGMVPHMVGKWDVGMEAATAAVAAAAQGEEDGDARAAAPPPPPTPTPVRYDRVLVDAECTHDGSLKHVAADVRAAAAAAAAAHPPPRVNTRQRRRRQRLRC